MTERKQLELDFKRGEKLAIITKIMKRNVFNSRMLLALRAIDDRAQNQSTITLTYQQIGDYLSMSRATAKRGVADLEKYDLLIKTPVLDTQGQKANQYQLLWTYLQLIADGHPLENPAPDPAEQRGDDSEIPAPVSDYESSQVLIHAGGQKEGTPGHYDPPPGSPCTDPPGHHDPAILYPFISRINPPPPINHRSWEGVGNILISLGVAAAGRAISNAQANRCGPADVLPLIEHYQSKPGAYQPGALFRRVSQAMPGGDPASGWPLESAKWLRSRQQADQVAQRDQAAQKAAARQAEIEARQQARQVLEAEYGPALDEMNEAERFVVAQECGPIIAAQLARDRRKYQAGEMRLFLLTKIKERESNQVKS